MLQQGDLKFKRPVGDQIVLPSARITLDHRGCLGGVVRRRGLGVLSTHSNIDIDTAVKIARGGSDNLVDPIPHNAPCVRPLGKIRVNPTN